MLPYIASLVSQEYSFVRSAPSWVCTFFRRIEVVVLRPETSRGLVILALIGYDKHPIGGDNTVYALNTLHVWQWGDQASYPMNLGRSKWMTHDFPGLFQG